VPLAFKREVGGSGVLGENDLQLGAEKLSEVEQERGAGTAMNVGSGGGQVTHETTTSQTSG